MMLSKTRSRVARAAFVALLMSSAATGALAAPAARDAKLQAMQQQLDEMRAQMEQMRAQSGQSEQLAALQQQLADFGQQLADMKSAQAAAASDIITLKTPTGSTVVPKLSNGRPTFATADGNFSAGLKAVVMFDAASYMQKDNLPSSVAARDLNDGTNFRRARFGIDGTLFKDFSYTLLYEFGGSGAEEAGRIQEAFFQYNGLKPFRFRLGAFEPNIGLAAASSTSGMPLLERPASAEIARNVAAGDARSALQVSANGIFGEGDTGFASRWFVSTAVTGNVVGQSNAGGGGGEQQAWIGRVAVAPFNANGLQAHLGANAQYVFHPADATGPTGTGTRYGIQLRDRPELRVDGARLIDTSSIDANHASVYGAEAALGYRSFLVEGEYFKYDIERRVTGTTTLADPEFDGWYVQGSWVLTGEARAYNGADARFDAPKPNFNFNPAAGTWGAWEVAARYSTVNLNDLGAGVRGGEQKIASVGVNWYLNPTMRLMLNYLHVDVDRQNSAGAQIGQEYNAVALRSQLSF
ncbi:porin [Phenylobacterium sp. LjRoot225]|uniref:OprO/OprP family phosphate-selective porin n=1 Tax=Phenylobacterium sp. LjRoot225 TaxID=3342285 RepID=UPI003ECF8C6D